MENGLDTKNIITISVYPADEGFGCTIIEPKIMPLTSEYSIALTIAHGMVKMALERPDIIFDEGVESLTNPKDESKVTLEDMLKLKKTRIH